MCPRHMKEGGPELSFSNDDCEGVKTPSTNLHRKQLQNLPGGQGFEGSVPESAEDLRRSKGRDRGCR